MPYPKGAKVEWKWLGRAIRGEVLESFAAPVTLEIKGKKIKRNASPEKPAYRVRSEAGNEALKLETELFPSPPARKSKSSPKMFSE
ncbi:MAG: DUF2945 domain-containing protein [Bdellovibrionaceae bacterium]|nr:DUF2945 domain-containing protein [Pseudobdellovibrionaceae bacterium]